MIRTLTLAAALAALCTPAFADTLKVPQDFETIQAAIDAAGEGDTVSVSAGQYTETISISSGKDGLTLTGKGKVYINAQPQPDEEDGSSNDALVIQSNDVTISKLAIRHAKSHGILAATVLDGNGPPMTLTGITIDKVMIINCGDAGIDLDADGATVSNCTLVGNGDGIQISGDDALVTKTRVLNDDDAGVEINGNNAVVENCTFAAIEDGGGVYVSGSGATVKKNSVTATEGPGIEVTGGKGHLVEGNRIDTVDGDGIYVDGDESRILKNAVASSCEDGIDAYGNGLVIVSNTVTHVPDDADGIVVGGPGPPEPDGSSGSFETIIEKNKVFTAVECGYNLRLIDSMVSKNLAQACGSEDEGGFILYGSGNTLEKNTSKNGDDTGFYISGDNNLLLKNKATDNTDNGIWISNIGDTGNVLEGNSVSNNFGDGIQNEGTATVMRGNKLKGNMQDVSNKTLDGANYIDEGGNKFSTGGFATEPIVD